jgi:hypothetical protein
MQEFDFNKGTPLQQAERLARAQERQQKIVLDSFLDEEELTELRWPFQSTRGKAWHLPLRRPSKSHPQSRRIKPFMHPGKAHESFVDMSLNFTIRHHLRPHRPGSMACRGCRTYGACIFA